MDSSPYSSKFWMKYLIHYILYYLSEIILLHLTVVFSLDRILNPVPELLTSDYNKPKQIHSFEPKKQISSLASTEKFLIVGTVNEITGYDWKTVVTPKLGKPAWVMKLPSPSPMEQSDVNCLWLTEDERKLFAGCGDNKVYGYDLEDGRLVSTYDGHTDFVHCVHGK